MKIYLLSIVLQNTDNFKLLVTAGAFLPKIIGRKITGDLTVKLLGIGSMNKLIFAVTRSLLKVWANDTVASLSLV